MDFWSQLIGVCVVSVIVGLINIAKNNAIRKEALEETVERLTKIDIQYLDDKIQYASMKLGFRDEVYKVSEETLHKIAANCFDVNNIKRLVVEIMKYLKSTSNEIDVELNIDNTSKFVSSGIAGQYERNGHRKKIKINLKSDYMLYEIIAIVCHECTHDYLFSKKIEISPVKENEVLTDVAAIYLGFENYIKWGYKEKRRVKSERYYDNTYSVETEGTKIGYINSAQITHIIYKIKEFRNLYYLQQRKTQRQTEKYVRKTRVIKAKIDNHFNVLMQNFNHNSMLVESQKNGFTKKHTSKELSLVKDNFHLIATGELCLKINQLKSDIENNKNKYSDEKSADIINSILSLNKQISAWNKMFM